MKHPLFQPGETCDACVPTSSGIQIMECEITGPLLRRSVRDLKGNHMGYALAYKVYLEGATRESLFAECDLRKQFEPSDDELKLIWQPKRVAR